jgi:DNA-binding MarR family transcriptional regulator
MSNKPRIWKLKHSDVHALLKRRDLSWGQARLYLALADLTVGRGRDRDTVSMSDIAALLGGVSRPNVARAFRALERKGLVGQVGTPGKASVRWVVWPMPPMDDRTTPSKILVQEDGTGLAEGTQ